ncbi:MAG: DUF3016 domain-containing protein [Thauera aminoaromatica]|uniref:DUF3016 domain-containing protein n=2 Tax=Thauera aminoaromatica TaxID=164330 RepID=A0A5C7TB90_THASP|nr:MAG: DUF3016 domain-containing protein [Thauera aminoaromatica]
MRININYFFEKSAFPASGGAPMTICQRFSLPVAAMLLSIASATASAGVTVAFAEPGRYADAGASEGARTRTLAILERHIRAAARPCVGDDERLTVKVMDVDLAGEVDWSRSDAIELRVLREVGAPRIELDWVLADGRGQVIAERQEQVSDMEYLRKAARANFSRELLPYERLMLEDWSRSRLCRPAR